MRYFLVSLLTLLVIFFFAACNKKPKVDASMENMLRNGKWKLSAGTVAVRKPNGKDTTLDYLLFIPDCYKDDYLVFDSLKYGRRYSGSNTCSPADPEYFVFSWQLRNNNTIMDLYNGFNYIYGIVDTIGQYRADTLSKSPTLVLDTVIGTLDTLPGITKIFIELDTIRQLFFYGVTAGTGPLGPALGGFNINDASILNFSQSSFTLHFQMISYYIDSTLWHGASYWLPIDPVFNPGSYPIIRPDTFNYSLTYTNF